MKFSRCLARRTESRGGIQDNRRDDRVKEPKARKVTHSQIKVQGRVGTEGPPNFGKTDSEVTARARVKGKLRAHDLETPPGDPTEIPYVRTCIGNHSASGAEVPDWHWWAGPCKVTGVTNLTNHGLQLARIRGQHIKYHPPIPRRDMEVVKVKAKFLSTPFRHNRLQDSIRSGNGIQRRGGVSLKTYTGQFHKMAGHTQAARTLWPHLFPSTSSTLQCACSRVASNETRVSES